MISIVHCPPDGPHVVFNPETGEKYVNCFACSRCGCCARGTAAPVMDFNMGVN
jgi:hypothetical protein